MVNYSKGKIYKIQRVGGNSEIYIGSTTKDYLSQRMEKHRSSYKCWKKTDNNYFMNSFKIFDLYGFENCEILLLESVNCNSKDELHARERYHIENNTCVNKYIPGRKKREYKKLYRENNKERIKEQSKLYYEQNKERINSTCICECGCEITKGKKPRHLKTAKHKRLMEALNTK